MRIRIRERQINADPEHCPPPYLHCPFRGVWIRIWIKESQIRSNHLDPYPEHYRGKKWSDPDAAKCCRSRCRKMLQIRMPQNAADPDAATCCRSGCRKTLQIRMPQNATDPDAPKCCRSGCRKMMRNRMPQNAAEPDAAKWSGCRKKLHRTCTGRPCVGRFCGNRRHRARRRAPPARADPPPPAWTTAGEISRPGTGTCRIKSLHTAPSTGNLNNSHEVSKCGTVLLVIFQSIPNKFGVFSFDHF